MMAPTLRCNSVLAAVLSALCLAGCGGNLAPPSDASAIPVGSAPSTSPSRAANPGLAHIRFGLLPALASAPIYTNLETGAFVASGLEVSLTTFTDTAQVMVSIASGQLDMGGVTLGPAVLNALSRGSDIKLVASVNQDPPEHGALAPVLVRTDLIDSGQVKSFKDLKGRKVAVNAKATILDYIVGKLILDAALQPGDIDVVILPVPDQLVALSNRAIDAALPLQPIATQAVQTGVAKVLIDTVAPNAQLATIMTNTNWAAAHRDALVSFLTNHVKMIRRLSDGKIKSDDQALAAVERWVKTPPSIVKAAPDPYWPKDGRLNRKSLQEEQQFFLDHKLTNYATAIPIDSIVDESYLEEALNKLG